MDITTISAVLNSPESSPLVSHDIQLEQSTTQTQELIAPLTTNCTPENTDTLKPTKLSPWVCQSCGGKKAFSAVVCLKCYRQQAADSLLSLTCEQCSVVFLRPAGEQKKREARGAASHVFCSAQCNKKWRAERPLKDRGACQWCQKPLVHKDQKKFCSRICFDQSRVSGSDSLEQNGGYLGRYLALKPQVIARDQRQCVMTPSNRLLEVHHIDHCAQNNTMDNLITLSKAAHEFYHSLKEEAQEALRIWFKQKASQNS